MYCGPRRMVEAEFRHNCIVLKFIGQSPEVKRPKWKNRFPNPHHPRVFWAGLDAGDELTALVRDTETVLAPLGVAKDERPVPHLTLARIKDPVPLEPRRKAIATRSPPNSGRLKPTVYISTAASRVRRVDLPTMSEYRFQPE